MKKANRKKIGIVFATGSLLSIRGNKSIFFVQQQEDTMKWLSEIPELGLIADIEPFFILGESVAFSLDALEQIAVTLIHNETAFDGFVVIVRAENLAFAASACAFMIQSFGKPVIFTGSRHSPESIVSHDMKRITKMGGLGLRSNMINAVQIAADTDFKEIAIMFGNKIIKPTKAIQTSFFALNLFKAVDDDYLGRVDFGVSLQRQPEARVGSKRNHEKLSRNVLVVGKGLFQFAQDLLVKAQANKVLIIHLNENEKIDQNIMAKLLAHFRAVVLFNENYVLESFGAIALSKMTWDTALAKVLWADAAVRDVAELKTLLQKNIINEIVEA